MKTISSQAGTRLTRAKAALDRLVDSGLPHARLVQARKEFCEASEAVADELVAQNFHKAEGDDA